MAGIKNNISRQAAKGMVTYHRSRPLLTIYLDMMEEDIFNFMIRTLKRLEMSFYNKEMTAPTHFMEAICQLMLTNPYFKGLYKNLREKEKLFNPTESDDLRKSSLCLTGLFEEEYGTEFGFELNFFQHSLTIDIVRTRNLMKYKCYSAPHRGFYINFSDGSTTCASCHHVRYANRFDEDAWSEDTYIVHLMTRRWVRFRCKICGRKACHFQLARDCRACMMELRRSRWKLEIVNPLRVREPVGWPDYMNL